MALTLQDFGLDRLNADDRIALAQQLWDSVTREAGHQAESPGVGSFLLGVGSVLEFFPPPERFDMWRA